MDDKKIVLFDGVCAFCNYWVRFIFKYNKKKDLFFMPLQDERVIKYLPNDMEPFELKSVVFYDEGKIYTQSTAALRIGLQLNLFFRTISNILLIIPKILRDKVYNFIGKRRYTWFGKHKNCPIPSHELRKKFL